MEMRKIDEAEFVDLFGRLQNVKTLEMGGANMAHRGDHPDAGPVVLFQCDSRFMMISDDAGFLPGPHGY